MSLITKPVITDETGQQIVDKLHVQNMLLDVIAGTQLEHTDNLDEIAAIVRSGKAKDVFSIGDQIVVPWTDVATGRTYTMPWDVVHIPDTVTLEDGEEVPGMIIQSHYATVYGVPFSAPQAINVFPDGLAAGTYNLTCTVAWGNVIAANEKVQFTLTKAVPAGGQLAGNWKSDKAVDAWSVSSYASSTDTVAIETVSVSKGSGGTSLGELTQSSPGALNLGRIGYGNNRYRDSAMRQWLNSTSGAGNWWVPRTDFDRPPAEAATKGGFLSGFGDDFLSIIRPTRFSVSCNTVCDEGVTDTMADKVFLPSVQQMYFVPQAADIEGEAWEYWRRASGSETPLPTGANNVFPQMRTFALENHNSPQTVRLRSAYRASSATTWYVNSTGYASGSGASSAFRCAPACAIC